MTDATNGNRRKSPFGRAAMVALAFGLSVASGPVAARTGPADGTGPTKSIVEGVQLAQALSPCQTTGRGGVAIPIVGCSLDASGRTIIRMIPDAAGTHLRQYGDPLWLTPDDQQVLNPCETLGGDHKIHRRVPCDATETPTQGATRLQPAQPPLHTRAPAAQAPAYTRGQPWQPPTHTRGAPYVDTGVGRNLPPDTNGKGSNPDRAFRPEKSDLLGCRANPIPGQGQLPLPPGTVLERGKAYCSGNGDWTLTFASDGNLVVKDPASGKYRWGLDREAGVRFGDAAKAEFDADGRLRLTDASGADVWTIPTGSPAPGSRLDILPSGELAVLAGPDQIWPDQSGLLSTKADPSLSKSCTAAAGFVSCTELNAPQIRIHASRKATQAAIDVVARIYTEMFARIDPTYPKDKFNGFDVYLTNGETPDELDKLDGVKDMWTPTERNRLRGGSNPSYLWISEQMICAKGVASRNADFIAGRAVTGDDDWRSFDQVVHEMAHSIDRNRKITDTEPAYQRVPEKVEVFAEDVQSFFGVPKSVVPEARQKVVRALFPGGAVGFSCDGKSAPMVQEPAPQPDTVAADTARLKVGQEPPQPTPPPRDELGFCARSSDPASCVSDAAAKREFPLPLYAGSEIRKGDTLIARDGRGYAKLAADGALSAYLKGARATDHYRGTLPGVSNDIRARVESAGMDGTGNLVLKDAGGAVLWSSNASLTDPGARLIMGDMGELQIENSNGDIVWAHTGRPSDVSPVTRAARTPNLRKTMNADDIALLLRHNTLRAKHGVPPLKWSPVLSAEAKAYADSCRPGHSPFAERLGGENLAAFYPDTLGHLDDRVETGWYDEETRYRYNTPGFNMQGSTQSTQTGHFTQFVWASTREIGCGWGTCGGNPWPHELVCRYWPGGNYVDLDNTPAAFTRNVPPPMK